MASMENTQRTGMSLTIPVHVEVVRMRRQKCGSCGLRRVLFAFGVTPLGLAALDVASARCADCWGLR